MDQGHSLIISKKIETFERETYEIDGKKTSREIPLCSQKRSTGSTERNYSKGFVPALPSKVLDSNSLDRNLRLLKNSGSSTRR